MANYDYLNALENDYQQAETAETGGRPAQRPVYGHPQRGAALPSGRKERLSAVLHQLDRHRRRV